ncbi:hypothetical protein FN846DRAFT_954509 [Sphaerosporella brunnea]|uniref:SAP domain-containing protein n=1 Tax=Sphaerosporella brunnea TaxID=1250544 RepID=A0A5J5ET91_9PEZI|nr:hypothetical protein FN846DRAFT_954509 [Sphaerosporella brunnea]
MSTITAGKFTFSSLGLLYELEPRCTQAAITKRFSTPDQVNVRWLKAQLSHYGLKPITGTKDELEARLKRALAEGKLKGQPKELKDLEKGLKAAFEARSGVVGKKDKVEKKPAAPAKKEMKVTTTTTKITTKTTTVSTEAAKKKSTATAPKKKDAAVASALAAANKVSAKAAKALASTPTASSKPRVAFADQLLGAYTVTSPTFPSFDCSLNLFRHSTEPKITGTLDLGRQVRATCTLDWLPMAKQTRVPFSDYGEKLGVMDFSINKGVVKVKGTIETRMWGEVEWSGVKTEVKGEVKDELDMW